jgi:hypothetical protein
VLSTRVTVIVCCRMSWRDPDKNLRCSRDMVIQCSGWKHWRKNLRRPGSTPPCSSRSLTVPSPSITMKSRTCWRRATNWCARTSRSATRTKVCCCLVEYLLGVHCSSLTLPCLLIAELETRVEQLKASEVDMKNLFYREKEAREVLEYDYKQLAYECDKHRIASDRDLVNCFKSL